MDNFYQAYKGEDDFWDIEDFVSMTGNTIASMYQTYYQQQYAMLRQDKQPEVVTFDGGWLLEQEVDVQKEKTKLYALLEKPVMTFPYDKSSVGIQNVFITDPYTEDELDRVSISSLYQLKYIPYTDKVFYYPDVSVRQDCDNEGIGKIGFVNKTGCNVKKVRVLYVPVMNDADAVVPDGVISDAVTKTVLAMRQMATGNVVDETADSNQNKILQTELDKNTLVK